MTQVRPGHTLLGLALAGIILATPAAAAFRFADARERAALGLDIRLDHAWPDPPHSAPALIILYRLYRGLSGAARRPLKF